MEKKTIKYEFAFDRIMPNPPDPTNHYDEKEYDFGKNVKMTDSSNTYVNKNNDCA